MEVEDNTIITYKKFDGADKFLVNLWKLFPNIIMYNEKNTVDIKTQVNIKLLNPFVIESGEFCNLANNGIIHPGNFIGQGGFGRISEIQMNEDVNNETVKAVIISFKLKGGFEPFYVPIIVKTGLQPSEIVSNVASRGSFNRLELSDPMTEIAFGSMLSHLYDMGLCPFYSKYFSAFACTNNNGSNEAIINIVTEKASRDFGALLKRRDDLGDPMPMFMYIHNNPTLFTNLLFQYVYSLYIAKTYLGFVHFDTQYKNVMMLYTDRRTVDIPGMETIPYIYNGQHLDQKDYYVFVYNNNWIAIKNTGMMCKLIDFGVCAAFLNFAENPLFKVNVAITPTEKGLTAIGTMPAYLSAESDVNKRNTIDLQYLLVNLEQYMVNGVDVAKGTQEADKTAPSEYSTIIQAINIFAQYMYDDANMAPSNYVQRASPSNEHSYKMGKISKGPNKGNQDHFVRNHNVGASRGFEKTENLLAGLARYCSALGHSQQVQTNSGPVTIFYLEPELANVNFTDANTLFLDTKVSDYIKRMNNVSKLISQQKMWIEHCMNTPSAITPNDASLFNDFKTTPSVEGKFKICNFKIPSEIKKYDPNTIVHKKLFSPSRILFDNATGNMYNINMNQLPGDFLLGHSKAFAIYNIQINPRAIGINKYNEPGALIYQPYQNWLNFQNVPADKYDQYIEFVSFKIIRCAKNMSTCQLEFGKAVWNVALEKLHSPGFVINGGYFAVNNSINDIIDKGNFRLLGNMRFNEEQARKTLERCKIPQEWINQHTPLGYTYSSDRKSDNGTKIPIPKPYRPYFAVVVGWNKGSDKRIQIVDYEIFINTHDTIEEPVIYILDNGQLFASTQKVIKMSNNSFLGDKPIINKNIITEMYDFAFCAGPILIKEGKVVFDTNIMLNSEFRIDNNDKSFLDDSSANINSLIGEKYHIVPGARNSKMFVAEEGEGNQYFGMRHSARFMVHNVMATNKNGETLFFLVEGRGFDAPGMDRVQLAYLVNHFDIVTAVALDGGFSANGVTNIIDSPNLHILMNDPELRELGVSMIFTEALKDISKKSASKDKKPVKPLPKERKISPIKPEKKISPVKPEKKISPVKPERKISPVKEKEVIPVKNKYNIPPAQMANPVQMEFKRELLKNAERSKLISKKKIVMPGDVFAVSKNEMINVRVGDPEGNQTTKRIHKICMKGYDLKKWLSTGSYGAVYQVCETEHTCNYVIKIQDLSSQDDPLKVDRDRKREWDREVKYSALLYDDYNIGSKFIGFGFCEEDNIGIIISELWSGSLAGKGEQSPCISKKLTDKLEKEVNIIGNLGLVHGDILPKNVLVRKDKSGNITDATLTDFGTLDTVEAWQNTIWGNLPQIQVFYEYQNDDKNDKYYYEHNNITLSDVMKNPKLLDQSLIYYLRRC